MKSTGPTEAKHLLSVRKESTSGALCGDLGTVEETRAWRSIRSHGPGRTVKSGLDRGRFK